MVWGTHSGSLYVDSLMSYNRADDESISSMGMQAWHSLVYPDAKQLDNRAPKWDSAPVRILPRYENWQKMTWNGARWQGQTDRHTHPAKCDGSHLLLFHSQVGENERALCSALWCLLSTAQARHTGPRKSFS